MISVKGQKCHIFIPPPLPHPPPPCRTLSIVVLCTLFFPICLLPCQSLISDKLWHETENVFLNTTTYSYIALYQRRKIRVRSLVFSNFRSETTSSWFS